MADDICEIDKSNMKELRDNQDRKFKNSQRETAEGFVNGQDVFPFQSIESLLKILIFGFRNLR